MDLLVLAKNMYVYCHPRFLAERAPYRLMTIGGNGCIVGTLSVMLMGILQDGGGIV